MARADHIALFLPSLAAGGAERVLLGLAAHLVAQGRRCDLVVASGGGAWKDRVPNGVQLVVLDGRKPIAALKPLMDYLRRERPSVLLSSVFPANIVALLACAITRTPCVVREASRTGDDIRTGSRVSTLVNRIAMRLLYPRAATVVALTPDLARHTGTLAKVPAERIVVIPNPAPTMSEGRGSPESPPIVLACGRLVPQKDFATLLDAFALVARDRDARLVVLGDGPLRADLQAQADRRGIAPRVTFAGHAADVAGWMRRASVFVLSSRWEGFPNVLLEALATGCPAVSTDCSDAVEDLLDGGRFGAIVPVGDPAAMAEALGAVLEGRFRFDDAGTHLARYDATSVAALYLDLLDRAAQGAR